MRLARFWLRFPRGWRRAGLALLAAFGLGGALGYAAGAQRSLLGLAFLAGLLLGLVTVEALRRRRRAARVEREDTDPAEPPGRPYDLSRDRSTDKQRYLM